MSPKRRRTTAHFPDFDSDFELSVDGILTSLEQVEDEDDSQFVRAVQRIYKHRLLDEVMSMPEFASLKKKLAEITTEEARALINEIRSLPCAEAAVVEWSPELTHATCSNTAPYHLGAGKTALAAMFYLVKYFNKEAGSPNSALAVLIDARDHINEYGSKGPEANTPQHFARHLLSRCVNKGDQELSGTQSASVVLGFDSFRCSDITGFVDNHCAQQMANEMWLESIVASSPEGDDKQGALDEEEGAPDLLESEPDDEIDRKRGETDDHDEESEDDDESIFLNEEAPHLGESVDNGTGFQDPHQQPHGVRAFDSDDDEQVDEVFRQPSSKVYSIPRNGSALNYAVAVSQGTNYRYRGRTLRLLNYVEYCNMVAIEKNARKSARDPAAVPLSIDEADDTCDNDDADKLEHEMPTPKCGKGRKGLKTFDFDHAHPLCKHYVQVIKEKFIAPIRAGGTRPTFPKPLESGAEPSPAWLKQHDNAAAFYSSNFVPWSNSNAPDLSPEQFRQWVHEQHLMSKDSESQPFATRLIARGRLQEFRNYAFLGQLSKVDLQINRQYRQRNRRMWTDEEIADYFRLCGGAEGMKKAEDDMQELQRRQAARKTDVRRLETAERNEDWVNSLTEHASSLLGRGGVVASTTPITALRQSLRREHRSPTAAEANEAAENLFKAASSQDDCDPDELATLTAISPPHEFDLDTANEDSEVPYIFDTADQCKYPKELGRISDADFSIAKIEWDRVFKDAYKNNVDGTPRPPSNPEQRELARCVLKQVRAAHALKTAPPGTAADDEVILGPTVTENAAGDSSDIGIMVVGAPGVGKSHTVSVISFFIKHENLGTVLSSAYTGVAAIQV